MSVTLARGWNATLRDQLDFHYRHLFRPRVAGLTDEEYLWEPAAGSWSVRRRAEARAATPAALVISSSTTSGPSPTRRRSRPSRGDSRT